MKEYIFYYWFEGKKNPEISSSYLGDTGEIAPDGRKIVDWTYEVYFEEDREIYHDEY